MQKKYNGDFVGIICLFLGVLLMLSSCQQKEDKIIEDVYFGSSVYHSSFLFSKERNDTLKKSFSFDFNEWAIETKSFVLLGIFDEQGRLIDSNHPNIQVFIDDKPVLNGQFKLSSEQNNDGDFTLSLVFSPKLSDKNIQGYLKAITSDLDRINNNTEVLNAPFFTWSAQRQIVWNPIFKGIIIALTTIVILLLFWLLVLRPIVYKRFKKRSFTIQSPYFKKIPLKGGIRLTLHDNISKQKWTRLVFRGKELHYTHSFFTEPIFVIPKSRHEAFIRLNAAYTIQPFTTILKKGAAPYTLTNTRTHEKITFTFN